MNDLNHSTWSTWTPHYIQWVDTHAKCCSSMLLTTASNARLFITESHRDRHRRPTAIPHLSQSVLSTEWSYTCREGNIHTVSTQAFEAPLKLLQFLGWNYSTTGFIRRGSAPFGFATRPAGVTYSSRTYQSILRSGPSL